MTTPECARSPRGEKEHFLASGKHNDLPRAVAFHRQIGEHSRVAIDLKELVAARLGENYELHERHLNRTLVAAQRVIGFDKVYARAEGAYLYDMDNAAVS